MDRSPTAEDVCREMVARKGLAIDVASAGISAWAKRRMSLALASAADMIFVMEEFMKERLVSDFGQEPDKIICLNIPDIYERGDPKLVRILQEALEPHLSPLESAP